MDDSEREDVFLLNAALGTDLVTSYVAATDNKPPKPTGCFTALLAVLLVLLALWATNRTPVAAVRAADAIVKAIAAGTIDHGCEGAGG